MTADRDVTLGAALRQLEVPEHAPDFFERLVERLAAEAEERSRPRRLVPRPPAGATPRFLGLVAAVLVVVLAVTWVTLPGRDGTGLGPSVATADELRARVAGAVSSAEALRGDISVEYPSVPTTVRSSFVVTAAGDLRVVGITRQEGTAYDAETGVLRTYAVTSGGRVVASEVRGAPLGPPDSEPAAPAALRSLASVVRAFLEADADLAVDGVTYEGRPAWRVVVPVSVELERRPDAPPEPVGEIDVTVDRRSGFPVRTITRAAGSVLSIVRLSDLEVDPELGPGFLDLAFPPATPAVTPVDLGFRRLPLAYVAGRVGYAPLVPQALPEGFQLAEVAVADQPRAAGAGNPPSRNVVSVAYQRGFDRFVVTTRAVGDDPARWRDPLSKDPGGLGGPEPERVTLSGGALAGVQAEIVLRTQEVPHAWALSGRLVVTVAGDLTRDELVAVAKSLRVEE